jgi:hypothetical protein
MGQAEKSATRSTGVALVLNVTVKLGQGGKQCLPIVPIARWTGRRTQEVAPQRSETDPNIESTQLVVKMVRTARIAATSLGPIVGRWPKPLR